ncbi:hypothetical protein V8F33_004077 [Rhypophila sp. PSN 637]
MTGSYRQHLAQLIWGICDDGTYPSNVLHTSQHISILHGPRKTFRLLRWDFPIIQHKSEKRANQVSVGELLVSPNSDRNLAGGCLFALPYLPCNRHIITTEGAQAHSWPVPQASPRNSRQSMGKEGYEKATSIRRVWMRKTSRPSFDQFSVHACTPYRYMSDISSPSFLVPSFWQLSQQSTRHHRLLAASSSARVLNNVIVRNLRRSLSSNAAKYQKPNECVRLTSHDVCYPHLGTMVTPCI